MTGISRNEGYRLARGKEEAAIRLARRFILEVLEIETEPIVGRDDNYRLGDLRCVGSGVTVEVKGQPIGGYPQNFVEVFEDTTEGGKEIHRDGFDRVAKILCTSRDNLAAGRVRRYDLYGVPSERVGEIAFVSVSLTSMLSAKAVIYVNTRNGLLFLYSSAYLLSEVRKAFVSEGFVRGKGRSNDASYAVHIPNSAQAWQDMGMWLWRGTYAPMMEARGQARALLT